MERFNIYKLNGRILINICVFFIFLCTNSGALASKQAQINPSQKKQNTTASYNHKKVLAQRKNRSISDSGPQQPANIPLNYGPNLLYRSQLKNSVDIGHIDPFTGDLFIHLPLLNIPGNDGLNMEITLNHSDLTPSTSEEDVATCSDGITIIRDSGIGYKWDVFVGLLTDSWEYQKFPLQESNPIFQDPEGKRHVFYPTNNGYYISKDNWKATLTKMPPSKFSCNYGNLWYYNRYSGTIISPNGIRYTVTPSTQNNSPVVSITSPHGGNVINYTYNNNGKLIKISSNNGFTVTFSYTTQNGLSIINKMMTSDGRTWTFLYNSIEFKKGEFSRTIPELEKITLPDNSNWQFVTPSFPLQEGDKLYPISTIQSPFGRKTTYTYAVRYCSAKPVPVGGEDRLTIPYITSKTVTGPNIKPEKWTYTYEFSHPVCAMNEPHITYGKTTTVTGPNKVIKYTFNNETNDFYYVIGYPPPFVTIHFPLLTPNGGVLTNKQTSSLDGTVLENVTYNWTLRKISDQHTYLGEHDGFQVLKYSMTGPFTDYNKGTFTPVLTKKTIVRDSASNFSTTYSNFNEYGYPQHIVEQSDNGTRSKDITYYINPDLWIITPQNETTYDEKGNIADTIVRTFDTKGNLVTLDKDGVVTSYVYDDQGNLTSSKDALGNITRYADYLAGLPQTITDALGHKTTYKVEVNGTVSSITDKKGNTTAYKYDAMYRPSQINKPINAPINISWSIDGNGLITETLDRGNFQEVATYNADGKPSEIETLDKGTGTKTFVFMLYDADDNLIFKSYPLFTINKDNTVTGLLTTYDALDRISSTEEPYTQILTQMLIHN